MNRSFSSPSPPSFFPLQANASGTVIVPCSGATEVASLCGSNYNQVSRASKPNPITHEKEDAGSASPSIYVNNEMPVRPPLGMPGEWCPNTQRLQQDCPPSKRISHRYHSSPEQADGALPPCSEHHPRGKAGVRKAWAEQVVKLVLPSDLPLAAKFAHLHVTVLMHITVLGSMAVANSRGDRVGVNGRYGGSILAPFLPQGCADQCIACQTPSGRAPDTGLLTISPTQFSYLDGPRGDG